MVFLGKGRHGRGVEGVWDGQITQVGSILAEEKAIKEEKGRPGADKRETGD